MCTNYQGKQIILYYNNTDWTWPNNIQINAGFNMNRK